MEKRVKSISSIFLILAACLANLAGCRLSRGDAPLATTVQVPPAETHDYMGCRRDATTCHDACDRKVGVTIEEPAICPPGGFEGRLACFCEKVPTF